MDFADIVIVAIITIVGGGFTSLFLAFINMLSAKPKTEAETEKIKAETESKILDNLLKNQALFKELLSPMQQEIEQLKAEIEELKPLVCRVPNCQNRITFTIKNPNNLISGLVNKTKQNTIKTYN